MASFDDEETTDVRQARLGDHTAFGRLVHRHQDMAVAYTSALLGDFHLGQDAAQEAFLEAYVSLRKLRNPATFRAWLRLILFKQCDRIRRKRAVSVVDLNVVHDVASESHDPVRTLEQKETRGQILSAVAALSVNERQVMLLYHMTGYSYRQIAELLGIAEKTVKSRLHSARRHMKDNMYIMLENNLNDERPSRDSQFAHRVQTLVDAVNTGNAGTVRSLVAHDKQLADAKVRIPFWSTDVRALHLAVQHGNLEVVSELIAAGADVNAASDELQWRPIHLATKQPEMAALLIAHGAHVDIFAAADLGDADTVEAMLKHEPDLAFARGPDGATALHFAATPEIARTLIDYDAELNALDQFHRGTPLQWSIAERRGGVVEFLLSCGAEIDLWSACALDDVTAVTSLLAKSPGSVSEQSTDRNILRSGFHAYPLHFAARYGSTNAARTLIEHGASVLMRSSDGSLPIHDAAYMGHLDAVKLLIEHGSPLNDREVTYGATPLGAAEYAGRNEVVDYLRAIGGE